MKPASPRLPGALLPLLLTLTLAACANRGPDYRPPASTAPATWMGTAAPGFQAQSASAPDLAQWWRQLNDPILTDLIDMAVQGNNNLRTAQARLRESRARRAVAEAGRYPGITAAGSASLSKGSQETGSGATRDSYSAGFDAAWEPDVFGATRRGIEAAEADLAASAADLAATRVSLAAEVAHNYVELRGFQARLAIARANLASQGETLQLTEWRAQAGLTSALDVEQARGNLEQTRAQIPSLETSRTETAHRLALLTGQPPASLLERLAASGAIPAVPARILVAIPAASLAQRPDLIAAERRLAAATARIGEAEAARWPGFQLTASLGLEALSLGNLAQGSALARSLVASVTAPIFDAGRLRQQVEIQNALQEQALVSYQQAVLTALEEVENALAALANNRQRQAALGVAAESSRNAALLASQRYASGLTDFQVVLDAQRSLLSAEDSLKTSEADGATALIQLYKALGGGWEVGK